MQIRVKIMPILETIVCQTIKGKEARFERMVKARAELSNRQNGCIKSWYGISNSDEYLYLIQTAYDDLDQFHVIKKLIEETLDTKDGGLESCLSGPPLLGLFEIEDNALDMAK